MISLGATVGHVTKPTECGASTGNGMSMADDNPLRSNRSNDPYRRAGGATSQGDYAGSSDPLAELARLIGQNDPFAEFARARPAAHSSPSTAPDWEPDADREQRFAAEEARLAERESYAASDHYSRPLPHPLAPRDSYGDDRGHGQRYDDSHAEADHQFHGHADDRVGYEAQQAGQAHGYEADQLYQDDRPLDPHEDAMYDDAPRARRHGGIVTALALIGCAMLGTAGAYGYRTYISHPGAKDPPPVISADNTTPTKIVPTTAIDPQSSKLMDRLANAASNEQLVRRQEEPVVLKELGSPSAPRVVLPAPVAPAQGTPAAPPQNPRAAAPNSTEPKPVRTVTIRPDGGDVSGRPVGAPSASQAGATPPAPRATGTTPPVPRDTPPARGGSSPISLDPTPNETGALPMAPAPRARTAAAPAAAPETANASAGGHLVQLSSQRSEGEAQSSFRSLQAKFPNELGDRQAVIRRADLGSKGVYYRTMVGPFKTAQEASQFCSSYKAAGGQCVVPSN